MPRFLMQGEEDPIASLCRMAANIRYEALPEPVVEYAKRCILDTFGVIIGGSAMEGIPQLVDYVKEIGGKPQTLIPFYGGKVPAAQAGLAIGPMSRAMDFGDVHEEGGHCSEYTLATLLAAAGLKDKVSGKELITSFVVGQEIMIRIGIAFRTVTRGLPAGRSAGHAIFGCTAAVGKLLGLSLEELQHAEGISRKRTQPHSTHIPASLMIRVAHGFTAHDAITACLLARKGISGPLQQILTGPAGYLAFADWETDPDALTRGLGEAWEMTATMMKPYACCKASHTTIDGLLEQMKQHSFEAGDIARMEIDESSTNWSIVCSPVEKKWHPVTVPDCQFSMPYCVATAAYDKDVFLESYTAQARSRQDVRDLMARISAKEDSSLPLRAARITTTLKNGRVHTGDYRYGKGHPKNPFTDEELIKKFKKCVPYSAYKLNAGTVDSLIGAFLELDKVDDFVGNVVLPVTPK